MHGQLEKLQQDLVSYREIIDQFLSASAVTPKEWQNLFLEILVRTSQLYLDYVLTVRALPELERISSKKARFDQVQSNIEREQKLRTEFKGRMTAADSWPGFSPEHPFSEITGLHNRGLHQHIYSAHTRDIRAILSR